MIENYLKYLAMLEQRFVKFFEKQKEYLYCKPGCSKCCENAQYPFTKIEFEYLKIGFNQLPYNIKDKIRQNIEATLDLKHKSKQEKFSYVCPFLIDHVCSIYPYRGIICRSFGLLNVDEEKGSNIPFCTELGLNYHQVYDSEKKIISAEMFKKTGFKEEPLAFNIRYKTLIDPDFGKGFGFEFGEVKPLIDWFDN